MGIVKMNSKCHLCKEETIETHHYWLFDIRLCKRCYYAITEGDIKKLREDYKMSVNQKHYVMVGIDLLPIAKRMSEDELDVFFQKMDELEGNTGLTFIYDGMSGEYCFLGYVLNVSNEDEGMSPKIHHFASELRNIRVDVGDKLMGISTTEPSLISFTHWY